MKLINNCLDISNLKTLEIPAHSIADIVPLIDDPYKKPMPNTDIKLIWNNNLDVGSMEAINKRYNFNLNPDFQSHKSFMNYFGNVSIDLRLPITECPNYTSMFTFDSSHLFNENIKNQAFTNMQTLTKQNLSN